MDATIIAKVCPGYGNPLDLPCGVFNMILDSIDRMNAKHG